MNNKCGPLNQTSADTLPVRTLEPANLLQMANLQTFTGNNLLFTSQYSY